MENIKLEYFYDFYFYVLIIFLCFIIYRCKNSKKEYFGDMSDEPLINILTRTGNRKNCFNKLKKSLDSQTYTNYRHIKSNDNDKCDFLENEEDVINLEKGKKYNHHHCPYNLYLNNLIEKVDEGWIIILDDDAKFVDNNYLMNLSKELKKLEHDKILITNIHVAGDKRVIPNGMTKGFDVKNIHHGNIDMGCIAFHHTNKTRFRECCAGDLTFYKESIEKYEPVFANIPVGIWVNYSGSAQGGNITCE